MTLLFFVLFSRGVFKFIFNYKYILISLLSLEIVGFSIFMVIYSNHFFISSSYILTYICLLVGGSSVGLTLLITFSIKNNIGLLSSVKTVIN